TGAVTAAALPFDRAERAQALGVPETAVNEAGEVAWGKIFLGFGGMVVGQFMAMLDIQIVAGSLAQIQSGLSASADEISWIQTIYLLAEVITIPLAAYLSKLFGTRPFYVTAVVIFIVASMAVGVSGSFEAMIVLRAIQGLAAGAMIPAVFATAMTVFPPEKRVMANVITGLVVTLAPTIGPTLGGHLTEALSWRWLFFINLGPGVLVIFLVGRYGGFDKADPSLAKGIDWFGLAVMTVFLLTLQYALEEGASEGWFDDPLILWLCVTAAVTGVVFVWRQITYRQPIVSLKPFVNKEFTVGFLMSFVAGASIFGGTFLIPIFLGQVLQYTAAQVGTTMLVSGLTMFVSAPLCGRLVRSMDLRISMVLGFALAAWATALGGQITEDWGFREFAILQSARSFGVMMAMIASQQLSVSTLPPHMMKDASGLVNLVRNFGGAVGLAVLSTVLSHQTAVHLADISAAVNYGNLSSQQMLDGLTAMMQERGAADAEGAARKAFGFMIRQKAVVLGFGDGFYFLALGCVVAGFIALFSGKARAQGAGPAPAAPKAGGH
ncbi:MAG TPA: DHA2 family efflux MFS transporter permease subunit, partial [Phenylobacterium sp.]